MNISIKILTTLLAIITIAACSSNIKSLASIDRGYIETKYSIQFQKKAGWENEVPNDTLLVMSYINNMPFEGLYLFENDSCYFQQLNIYCSPCADKMIEEIIKDRNYDFEAIDEVNYISKKDKNIILRLKEKRNEEGNCNVITILRTNS